MTTFPVAYATDNGYVQHVAVSIYSLLSNQDSDIRIDIYILDNKLSAANRDKLTRTANKFNARITYVDISNIEQLLPKGIDTANLSISTYCRLFLPQLMPYTIDKLLYLDCDTLVCDNVRPITSAVKGDSWYVAGVEDTMYPQMKEAIGLSRNDLYINAGVLYINLRRWRDDNLTERFIEFINRFDGRVPHLDQGVINGVFRTGKVRIPLRYNVQAPIYAIHSYKNLKLFFDLDTFYTPADVADAKLHPAIIHYTSFFVERPWFKFCLHPRKNDYRATLRLTEFTEAQLLNNKISLVHIIKDIAFRYFQLIYIKLRK